MSFVHGHDPWAGVDTRHLDDHPEARKKALKLKNRIIRSQVDRVFVKNEIRPGSEAVNRALITTKAHLDAFCEKVLEELDHFFKVIFLETRGDSDCWVEKRLSGGGAGEREKNLSSAHVGLQQPILTLVERPRRVITAPIMIIPIGMETTRLTHRNQEIKNHSAQNQFCAWRAHLSA